MPVPFSCPGKGTYDQLGEAIGGFGVSLAMLGVGKLFTIGKEHKIGVKLHLSLGQPEIS